MTPAALLMLAWVAASPGPGPGAGPFRVEPRLLVKQRHLFLTGGGTYLARGDYYSSPGLSATGTWFFTEHDGVELRASYFFSRLNAAGTEVFDRTGLLPDAHRPKAAALAGYRRSFAYGKAVLGASPTRAIHFDLQGALGGGVVVTDRAVTPAAQLGPVLLVRLTPLVFTQLDIPVVLSWEERNRGDLSVGVLPTLSLGVTL